MKGLKRNLRGPNNLSRERKMINSRIIHIACITHEYGITHIASQDLQRLYRLIVEWIEECIDVEVTDPNNKTKILALIKSAYEGEKKNFQAAVKEYFYEHPKQETLDLESIMIE